MKRVLKPAPARSLRLLETQSRREGLLGPIISTPQSPERSSQGPQSLHCFALSSLRLCASAGIGCDPVLSFMHFMSFVVPGLAVLCAPVQFVGLHLSELGTWNS